MIKVLIFLIVLVAGKGKTSDRIKREECDKIEICKWDKTENCALRCMSEKCYERVYGDYPLEAGEISRDKSKLFLECFKQEEREMKQNKYKT